MSALKNKNHRKSCDKYFTKIVVTFLTRKIWSNKIDSRRGKKYEQANTIKDTKNTTEVLSNYKRDLA